MWHEARRHEKKIRGLIVDYKRRAERRRDFYEKIRRDPAQFLQIHGRLLKVHLDSTITAAAEGCLMPWRGEEDNLIDRFDVRAHLDCIQSAGDPKEPANEKEPLASGAASSRSEAERERQINYERWRNLVQNEYLGISEAKCLHQIYLEERFGMNQNQNPIHEAQVQQNAALKKKLAEKKATIAYNYDQDDDSSYVVAPIKRPVPGPGQTQGPENSSSSSDESDSDVDYDTNVCIESLSADQGIRINAIAHKFGMKNEDFLRYMEEDKAEAERIRLAKEMENEKSMFAGRKSRRERKALKERRMLIMRANNNEETNRDAESLKPKDMDSSSSDSLGSEVDEAKIEFITSFGGSSEEEAKEPKEKSKKQAKVKSYSHNKRTESKASSRVSSPRPVVFGPSLPSDLSPLSSHEKATFNSGNPSRNARSYRYRQRRSRSRSRSPLAFRSRSSSHSKRRRSRSRSRGKDRSFYTRRRTRSRSGSRDRTQRRHRSRSRSRSRSRRRSRSMVREERDFSRNSSRSKKRVRSRSRSHNRGHSNSRLKEKSRDRRRSSNRSVSESREKTEIPVKAKEKSDTSQEIRVSIGKNSIVGKSISCRPLLTESSECVIKTMPELPVSVETNQIKLPSPPIKRYYRHDLDKEGSDNNESEEETFEERLRTSGRFTSSESKPTSSNAFKVGAAFGVPSVKPQERLKKKMQAQIDRHYKQDKKAERVKFEKQEQERVDRDEELREMSYKIKRKDHDHRRSPYSRTSSSSSSSDSY